MGLIADNCYAGVYLSFYGLLEGQPMTVRIRNVQISNCTHSLIVFWVTTARNGGVDQLTMRNNVHGHYISVCRVTRLVMTIMNFTIGPLIRLVRLPAGCHRVLER